MHPSKCPKARFPPRMKKKTHRQRDERKKKKNHMSKKKHLFRATVVDFTGRRGADARHRGRRLFLLGYGRQCRRLVAVDAPDVRCADLDVAGLVAVRLVVRRVKVLDLLRENLVVGLLGAFRALAQQIRQFGGQFRLEIRPQGASLEVLQCLGMGFCSCDDALA